MSKVILITNLDKVALLEDMGFTPCGIRNIDNKVVYQFVVTDKLYKVLNDKSKFSKKDYVYDIKLTF